MTKIYLTVLLTRQSKVHKKHILTATLLNSVNKYAPKMLVCHYDYEQTL